MIKISAVALVVLLASCTAVSPTEVTVTDAWAQPLDARGKSVAAYMTIHLRCSTADTLQSVTAMAPLNASMHESRIVENALAMKSLASIPIPCGRPFMLKPLDKHVMVTGLARPATIGTSIPLTLTFRDAGKVNVSAAVTTMALLENVDPMNMHGGSHGSDMGGMHMH